MDAPGAQLPRGWENLPETTLFQLMNELPWQSLLKICGTSARSREVCQRYWLTKSILEFGEEPMKIYEDEMYNYLAAKNRKFKQLLWEGEDIGENGMEKYEEISDVLVKHLKETYPDRFKWMVIRAKPKEIEELWRWMGIGSSGHNPKDPNPEGQKISEVIMYRFMEKYPIPDDTLVFIESDNSRQLNWETPEDVAYTLYMTDKFWNIYKVPQKKVAKRMYPYMPDKEYPPFLYRFLIDAGISTFNISKLFTEELKR